MSNLDNEGIGNSSWFYLDSKSRERKGPIPTSVIVRLLEKGLLGLDATTQIWQQGMPEWKSVADIPELRAVVEFQNLQWYYLDHSHQQQGPIFSRFLVHKLKEGELDGLSLVYGGKNLEWKTISEIPELKEAMRKIAEEEAALVQAQVNEEQQLLQRDADLLAQQTYIPFEEELIQPAYDKKTMSKNKKDVATNRDELAQHNAAAPKYFEDDNGRKFKWDEEEQDWVMMDEDEEKELDRFLLQQNNSSSNCPGKSSGPNKRKKHEMDDAEDDNEVDNDSVHSHPDDAAQENTAQEKKKRKNRKKKRTPSTWIYVEGLPSDITFEELKTHFSKVGLIALNPLDQQPRIKIYRDAENMDLCKGDCSICFNSEGSVQLALDILDGGYIRPNYKISVSRATFDRPRADENNNDTASNNNNHHSNQAQVKVARNAMRAALAWVEEDDSGMARSSALKIIVLEGMFQPADFLNETFERELEDDIASECAKFGRIEKMTIFSKHPRGIIVVKFTTGFSAQECIRVMNGRYFGGRSVKSYYWDGVTNFSMQGGVHIEEEEEKEEEKRLEEFGSWLEQEQEELPEEFRLRTE